MTLIQTLNESKTARFQLRPPTMDDLDAVVALINASGMDQFGKTLTNRREVLDDWNRTSFNLASSARVAESPDAKIVGYIEVWDIDPLPVANWVWARVDPRYEGLGVGTALMDWADERLQNTLSRVPEDVRVSYFSAAASSHLPSKQFFEDRDMALVRRFWHMMIEFDEAPPLPKWPAGIRLATFAEQDDLRAIVRADNEAFGDHWGHVAQPEDAHLQEFQDWIDSQSDFDPNVWFLAIDGEEIAGICLCSRNRAEYPGAAWVNTLAVRRLWRKKGIGLALLHHAFGVFYREGKEGVGLGVDSSNLSGATRLYERAGMSIVKQNDSFEKEIRPGRDVVKRE